MSITASPRTLEARFADAQELRRAHEAELRHGGLLLRGAEGLEERQRVTLRLRHPDAPVTLELAAEVVWIGAEGAGLHLLDEEGSLQERIRAFVETEPIAPGEEPTSSAASGGNPYLRLRGLPLAEQLRCARKGELQERVALERLYGKAVWETLLSNPRISVVEVARIARKGQVPMPLIEQIVGNDGWLASGEVRRALLTNPRLRGRALRRVLSSLPPAELKLVEQQTAYPSHVRMEARRLVARR